MSRRLLVLMLVVVCGAAFGADNPVVTVLDLQVDQVSDSEMRTVISLLSSALFKTGKLTVIDVAERDNLLKEIEFSAQDCTDENCQLEIGKLLAAEYIVVGRFGKLGKKYILSVKMLETSSSRTVSTADGSYTELDEVVEDMPSLAAQLAGSPAPAAPKAAAQTAAQPSGAEAAAAEPAPAAKPRAAIAPVRIAALVAAGGAVACGAVAAPLLVGAIQYFRGPVETAFQDYMDEPDGSTVVSSLYTAYLGQYETFRGRLIPAIAVGGGAAALLVASGVLAVVPAGRATAPGPAAISLAPTPGGVALSFRVPVSWR